MHQVDSTSRIYRKLISPRSKSMPNFSDITLSRHNAHFKSGNINVLERIVVTTVSSIPHWANLAMAALCRAWSRWPLWEVQWLQGRSCARPATPSVSCSTTGKQHPRRMLCTRSSYLAPRSGVFFIVWSARSCMLSWSWLLSSKNLWPMHHSPNSTFVVHPCPKR